jgi:hypothetical protein
MHSRQDDAAALDAIVPAHGLVGAVPLLVCRAKQQSDALWKQ